MHTGLLLPFDTEIVIAAEVNRRTGLFSVKLSVTIPKIRFICDPRQLEGTFIGSTYTFFDSHGDFITHIDVISCTDLN